MELADAAGHLIYSPSYGLNEFTVPQFDAFIRRSFSLEGPS